MALYLIAIGGTGAKCVEALVHLAGAGLCGEDFIWIVFVDQDEANGNVTRARTVIEVYRQCRALVQNTWMTTQIEVIGDVWAPVSGANPTLSDFFNYHTYRQSNPKLGHLFEVLYGEAEREISLEDGFRGRPAIGSAVMSHLQLAAQEPWRSLIEKIEKDPQAKVFLCGSVFGGTGASGLPTIARLIANQFEGLPIGGLLMLPYFEFPVERSLDEEVYAKPEEFLLTAEVALRYYRTQAHNSSDNREITNYLGFSSIYLLGTPKLSPVSDRFKLGRAMQENRQHFLELFGALAIRHFQVHTPTNQVLLLKANDPLEVTWNDLPESSQVQENLIGATRFAFAWTAKIVPELREGLLDQENMARSSPWVEHFYKVPKFFANPNLPELSNSGQQQALSAITTWCKTYLQWLKALHEDEVYKIRLFNTQAFGDFENHANGQNGNFAALVDESSRIERKRLDTVQRLVNRLDRRGIEEPNQGTVGLAKALYRLCQK
ncbi:hypothetical protein [Gloeothece verrucosa]|uniref:Tubulin-like protein n=1 Tax=Gloeothece verrucosa (strain PCC 7822) TaxID=497965 RepID=E0U674_GLOV7|nr:hypothetical protein [Gloeothece verrucosa]ADN12410.1 conserved hypothetical protein [Gloeothece verrucosa PCC 7822]